MRHRDDGAGVLLEVVLEPAHGLGVEVVGGLVEQQHVGLREQQLAERDAAPLAARDLRDVGVPGRQAQRVGGDLELALEVVAVRGLDDRLELRLFGGDLVEVRVGLRVGGVDRVEARQGVLDLAHRDLDVAAHVLRRVELRLLLQEADLDAGLRPRLALELLVDARHDPQQGGLARAVQAQHADLGAREEAERDVAEDHALRGHDLPDAIHRVDELGHGSGVGSGGKRAAIMGPRGARRHGPRRCPRAAAGCTGVGAQVASGRRDPSLALARGVLPRALSGTA